MPVSEPGTKQTPFSTHLWVIMSEGDQGLSGLTEKDLWRMEWQDHFLEELEFLGGMNLQEGPKPCGTEFP